jgi:nucleoside-diphosphate-sugar epimerase
VGLGYSAERVAARLAAKGWAITGSSRSVGGCERIRALGYRAAEFDGTMASPELRRALGSATHLLVSAAPDAQGDPLLRSHMADLAAAPSLAWAGYLSTVGVYGDHAGGWVDETTPPLPQTERGRRRVEAEQHWLALASARCAIQIFRLAGIYGPGQNQIEAIRRGEARRIVKPGQVFNRIHVDDIAGAVIAGIAMPSSTGIFNVADDLPAPPEEVIDYAASLLGVAPPPAIPFESAELSPMARSFYGEVKRVDNARAKRDLGWRLQYPTYREGLAALARG